MWDLDRNMVVQNQGGGKVKVVVSDEHRDKFSKIALGAKVKLHVVDGTKIKITSISSESNKGKGAR